MRQHRALLFVGQPHRPAAGDVKDAQIALFLRKLPRHISNLINPWVFKTTEELIQCCNKLWMAQAPEEAAAAAAAGVPSLQSPFRSARRSPSLFRRKTPGGDKSGSRCSPTPGGAKGGRSDSLWFSQLAAPPLLFSAGLSHRNVHFLNKKPNFPS